MLLEVKNLKTSFNTSRGKVRTVRNVSFSLREGEILGLVGESGCGKSVTSLSIMGLVPKPEGIIEGGEIIFEGTDLLKLSEKEMCKIRGNKIAMIYQEPMTALNPVFTIEEQISEVIKIHEKVKGKVVRERVIELLNLVQIPDSEKCLKRYPHELSGGMRQRVVIAMALACSPQILIADEPTTALDVTIQAEIIEVLKDISKKMKMAIIFITHDLDVIAEIADRVVVMYGGKIVEEAYVNNFFDNPLHPYSKGLMLSRTDNINHGGRLFSIQGMVPSPYNMPRGCAFNPRCEKCKEMCKLKTPELVGLRENHKVRCWLYRENEV
ncbi:ABC transporter ATP-binding protein [Oceanirhabdus sp. W0125-5]|uniref:ABC transporter ATP-binding protein n=1 Tax=Oceanirhabdus sp. W0125-5 TaxID=2999116 RepID=UPI0022F2E140|nr:ABC transporter ATP-binding protein [Oceanirhabdus sp. W0125-5]WBW96349.1 ABC transporter ATP-binding protein [Oceanirhabdus sp. W0125-5]